MSNGDAGWFSRAAKRAAALRNIIQLGFVVATLFGWLAVAFVRLGDSIEATEKNTAAIKANNKLAIRVLRGQVLLYCDIHELRPADCKDEMDEAIEGLEGH